MPTSLHRGVGFFLFGGSFVISLDLQNHLEYAVAVDYAGFQSAFGAVFMRVAEFGSDNRYQVYRTQDTTLRNFVHEEPAMTLMLWLLFPDMRCSIA